MQKLLLGLRAGKSTLRWPFSCALACLIRGSLEGSTFYSLFPHTVSVAAIVKLWGEGPRVSHAAMQKRDVNRTEKKKKEKEWEKKKSHVLPPSALHHLRAASGRLGLDRPFGTLSSSLPSSTFAQMLQKVTPPSPAAGCGTGSRCGATGGEGGRCAVYEPADGKSKRRRRETRCVGDSWESPCLQGMGTKDDGG